MSLQTPNDQVLSMSFPITSHSIPPDLPRMAAGTVVVFSLALHEQIA